jgi:2-polyprenyl-3-methyl-5-hydroxy-6-metoxy-1,4-benzoquinol methylase
LSYRNYDEESLDTPDRKYSYDFDLIARKIFLETVSSYISKDSRSKSLEVGSYDGSMAKLILGYVEKLTVVEPSPSLAQRVADIDSKRIEIQVSTIEEYKTNLLYDNIFLVHTLEHVEDPIRVLKKLKALLAPAGKIFIMVPNGNALSRQIAVAMGLINHNTSVTSAEAKQGHLRTYVIDTLFAEVRNSGLKVSDHGGIIVKALANFQFDLATKHEIVNMDYFRAANQLAKRFPDLSASLYIIAESN